MAIFQGIQNLSLLNKNVLFKITRNASSIGWRTLSHAHQWGGGRGFRAGYLFYLIKIVITEIIFLNLIIY